MQGDEFLGNAYAYLFPIDWPEPFGLTMVEAIACGTPVVATNCGSVPEIIEDGVSGYICRSLREMIDSVAAARSLDRACCRAYAEARFSASAMADGYERIYRQTLLSNDPGHAAMESARSAPGDSPAAQDREPASAAYAHSAGVLDRW